MSKINVKSGANDPSAQGKDDSVTQKNLEASHAAASAVGNQDSDVKPAPAKGSNQDIGKDGSIVGNVPSAGGTSKKGDH